MIFVLSIEIFARFIFFGIRERFDSPLFCRFPKLSKKKKHHCEAAADDKRPNPHWHLKVYNFSLLLFIYFFVLMFLLYILYYFSFLKFFLFIFFHFFAFVFFLFNFFFIFLHLLIFLLTFF